MATHVEGLRDMIFARYRSEAECARALNWKRQRLNKITTGKKIPDIGELNQLAAAIGVDPSALLHIFLDEKSTNGQQSA